MRQGEQGWACVSGARFEGGGLPAWHGARCAGRPTRWVRSRRSRPAPGAHRGASAPAPGAGGGAGGAHQRPGGGVRNATFEQEIVLVFLRHDGGCAALSKPPRHPRPCRKSSLAVVCRRACWGEESRRYASVGPAALAARRRRRGGGWAESGGCCQPGSPASGSARCREGTPWPRAEPRRAKGPRPLTPSRGHLPPRPVAQPGACLGPVHCRPRARGRGHRARARQAPPGCRCRQPSLPPAPTLAIVARNRARKLDEVVARHAARDPFLRRPRQTKKGKQGPRSTHAQRRTSFASVSSVLPCGRASRSFVVLTKIAPLSFLDVPFVTWASVIAFFQGGQLKRNRSVLRCAGARTTTTTTPATPAWLLLAPCPSALAVTANRAPTHLPVAGCGPPACVGRILGALDHNGRGFPHGRRVPPVNPLATLCSPGSPALGPRPGDHRIPPLDSPRTEHERRRSGGGRPGVWVRAGAAG